MLATLRFLPLLGLPLTYAATNIINASDPSLSFSPGWTEEFSQATQDLFSQTDVFGGSLTVTLPSAASSVSYIAFPRAGGSVYGYTLDCEDDCVLQTVNGSDPSVTDDASVFPSTIFSVDLDPSTQHTLRVYNIPSDQPDGSSEITFNSLSVDVQDNIVPTPGSLPGLSQPPDPPQTVTDSTTSTSLPPTSTVSPTSLPASTSLPVTPSSTPSSGSVGAVSSTSSSASNSGSASISNPASAILPPTNRPASSNTRTPSSGSSTSTTDDPSNPTNPVPLPNAPSSSASSAASSSSATHGLSKPVAIGISILIVVLVAVIVACLIVFLQQRRQKRRESFQSAPLSPTGSIIPIMSPPEMRPASLNPFSDPPYPQGPMDSPIGGSLMQRRMESRSVSPGTAPPNIPLPDIPLDRRERMESRPNTPATPFARNDLWITRSPARAQFSAV